MATNTQRHVQGGIVKLVGNEKDLDPKTGEALSFKEVFVPYEQLEQQKQAERLGQTINVVKNTPEAQKINQEFNQKRREDQMQAGSLKEKVKILQESQKNRLSALEDAGLSTKMLKSDVIKESEPVQSAQSEPTQQLDQLNQTILEGQKIFQQQRQALEDQTKAQQESFQKGLQETQAQFTSMSNELQSLFTALNDQQKKELQTAALDLSKAGQTIDLNNSQLQQEIAAAAQEGKSLKDVLSKYSAAKPLDVRADLQNLEQRRNNLTSLAQEAQQNGVDQQTIDNALNLASQDLAFVEEAEGMLKKKLSNVQPVDSFDYAYKPTLSKTTGGEITNETTTVQALDNIISTTPDELSGMFSVDELSKMNSGELLNAYLKNSITSANAIDKASENYLNTLSTNAKNAYNEGLAIEAKKQEEITKIINGETIVPTTYESLAAKVIKDSQKIQEDSINLEKQYIQEQFDAQMKGEREKRARLEGYLKAKLYDIGGQDSSAALGTMALYVNAADLRLQQAQSQHNYAVAQLNLQSRELMTNYTNKIVEISIDGQARKNDLKTNYDTKLEEIEKNKFIGEKDKADRINNIFATYIEKKTDIERYNAEQKYKEQQFAYQKARDLTEDAYRLSGLKGTVYLPDGKGGIYDTGVSTFDAQKWKESNALDIMQYNHNVQQDAYNNAYKFLDQFGTGAAGAIEDMLGFNPGTLTRLKTAAEMQSAIDDAQIASQFGLNLYDLTGNADFATAKQQYGDQEISLGIPTLDPMKLPEFRTGFEALDNSIAKVTQKFDTAVGYLKGRSEHGGYDIVFKDGVVRALTEGTVVDVIPDPNPGKKSGWGARVVVESPNGNRYQYAHFENGQIEVKPGQKVTVGSSLGAQGTAGYSTGDHLDVRLTKLGNGSAIGRSVAPIFGISPAIGNALGALANVGSYAMSYLDKGKSLPPQQQAQVNKAIQETYQGYAPQLTSLFETYKTGDAAAKKIVLNNFPSQNLKNAFFSNYNTWLTSSNGLGKDVDAGIRDARSSLRGLASGAEKQKAFTEDFDSYIKNNDTDGLKILINSTIANSLDAETKKKFNARRDLNVMLNSISADLAEYQRLDGNTGFFKGKIQNLKQNTFGQIGDPKLANLASKIRNSIVNYRQSISGAAFTESESKEYDKLFPAIDKVGELNFELIKSLQDTNNSLLSAQYSSVIGDRAFNLLYSEDFENSKGVTPYSNLDNSSFYNIIPK